LKLLVIGSAEEVEPDGAGRILIPPVLRKFAKLEKGVMFVGQGNKFAIWSEEAWQSRLDAAARLPDQIAEAAANGTLPEELKGFTL
jgi:MraZ protein